MKMKLLLSALAMTVALMSVSASAASMSASLTAPTVDGEDIANYGSVTGTDKWWNDAAASGYPKGQTFTTGSDPVELNAITYQITSNQKAEPAKTYVIRVGTASATTFTEIFSETAAQTFTWNSGEYMTWNQFDSTYTMNDLANMVASVYSDMMNKEVQIAHLENPREGGEVADEHYYNPDRDILPSFGYEPSGDLKQDVTSMLKDLMRYKDRIKARRHVLLPDVRWDGSREVTKVID